MTTPLPRSVEPPVTNGEPPDLEALVDRITHLGEALGRAPLSRPQIVELARELRQTAEAAAEVVRRRVDIDVSDPPDVGLSRREIEVLALVAQGRSTQDIAEELYVSVHTVRNHLHRIFGKLDVHSRVQAVATASRLGIVEVG